MDNNELQSRRQFFKRAARSALPILGAIILVNSPMVAKAAESTMSCNGNCSGGCSSSCTGCTGRCSGGCSGNCTGGCNNGCTGCRGTCSGNCKASSR